MSVEEVMCGSCFSLDKKWVKMEKVGEENSPEDGHFVVYKCPTFGCETEVKIKEN